MAGGGWGGVARTSTSLALMGTTPIALSSAASAPVSMFAGPRLTLEPASSVGRRGFGSQKPVSRSWRLAGQGFESGCCVYMCA